MKGFLTRWFTTTIAVLAASQLPGIHAGNWFSLIFAALMLGIVNALVRPLLLLLSLPLILVTFGFFILIVNAVMLYFVAVIVPGFRVDSFGSAFFGAIIISIVNWMTGLLFNGGESGVQVYNFSGRTRPAKPHEEIKQAKARVIENED